jgi:hypothetical protein
VRIFIEAVFARYRIRGRSQGITQQEAGAIMFVQRFGSSLNLNVHVHVAVLDGIFDRDQHGHVRFQAAPVPTRPEMDGIVRSVHKKVDAWLARHSAGAAPASASLETCATIAMRHGIVSRNPAAAGKEASDTPMEKPPHEFQAVEFEGFNLNANLRIDGDDDLARERLMRYGARPPFALERLGRRPTEASPTTSRSSRTERARRCAS